MSDNRKVHLKVRKDLNGWVHFWKDNFRVQLCWDKRKGGFWLSQYAKKLWKENFMKDFTEILAEMEKDNQAIFSLYILPEIIHWKIK